MAAPFLQDKQGWVYPGRPPTAHTAVRVPFPNVHFFNLAGSAFYTRHRDANLEFLSPLVNSPGLTCLELEFDQVTSAELVRLSCSLAAFEFCEAYVHAHTYIYVCICSYLYHRHMRYYGVNEQQAAALLSAVGRTVEIERAD